MNKSDYEKYHKTGGEYVIPIEIFNEIFEEIERLQKELEISKTNEETYRLEMLDITKRLGLDEETLFDEVKDKVERLNNIINELEKWLDEEYDYLDKYGFPAGVGYAMGQINRTKNKLKELKDSDKE